MRTPGYMLVLLMTVLLASATSMDAAEYSQAVEMALQRAGTNRPQLEAAMQRVRPERREGIEFLVVNMPARDLSSLSADFLLENTDGAYEAIEKVPWGRQVPKDIFLNDVLAYSCATERRDNWRRDFMTRFLPLVADCRTPGAAAAKLNSEIFRTFGVRYSKERSKPDQSPYESIDEKKSSCTGLSILLVAACRACGVPARLAGIPMWPNRSGNHTWVEVWDNGWHFTGAAEPAGTNLDQAWFAGQATTAKADEPLHSIYATSFRRTPVVFPLVWAPGVNYVTATNVTARYTGKAVAAGDDSAKKALPPEEMLAVQLKDYFNADPMNRLSFNFDPAMDRVLSENPAAVRKAAWKAYCAGWDRNHLAAATNRVPDARPGNGDAQGTLPDRVTRHVKWAITPAVTFTNWLAVPSPTRGIVEAECLDNRVKIRAETVAILHVYMDERLVDFNRPVTFEVNGKVVSELIKPSLRTLCETLEAHGDPEFMWTSRKVLTP